MENERALLNFIRAAVKDGGSVRVSFYKDTERKLKVSIEIAYMTLPMEDRELDIIKLNQAAGETEEPETLTEI